MVDLSWEFVGAAGALGTAAFGIVDGLKGGPVGRAGFAKVKELLAAFSPLLVAAYGPDAWTLLESQYRDGRSKGELPRTLRQGIRVGLRPAHVANLVDELKDVVDPQALTAAATSLQLGAELTPQAKQAIARFEMAVDARVDAAMGVSENQYIAFARNTAMAVAVLLALVAAWALSNQLNGDSASERLTTFEYYVLALMIGIAAVPIAPIAKDIASGLTAAVKAIGGNK